MDNAIPALVIGAILLVASSIMARGTLHSYEQLGGSIKEMETRMGEQARTRLTVTSATLDSEADTLMLSLRNDGQTRVAAFDRLDLIVTYFSSPTLSETRWLPYEAGAPNPGSWTIVSIADDVHEPGILNPGETAQIQVELGATVEPGKTNLIVIATDTGTSVTYPFAS
jgi:archaellum component FlaF (FlaF/FlaG flagellin family)